MSIAPGGTKLSAGQPYRPKSEKVPKASKKIDVDVYVASIIGGIAIAKLGGVETLGYGVAGLGVVTTALELVKGFNPYKNLFKNVGLKVNDTIPKYLGKRKTAYGHCLSFSLPVGLSTKDFDKNKLEIEQHLNRRIEIAYKNHRVFIKVFEVELDSSPIYEVVETKNTLEFPIGIEFGNKIVKVNLEEIIHLLIAGETGSGKSTIVRAILTNLIATDKGIKLHLIDLKNGAEFNVFRKSNKVKTFSRNIKEAEKVLTDLLEEVENRYDLFFENDVVDIKEFNKLRRKRKLDYQICVIDEFADLQEEKGSISAIETLAAKARACGIHLIISTQRPDAKVLNGRIKANVPGVIGLKTMNSLNSRIIIDEDGLEKLRGKGHGLLRHGELKEFQGMYLSVKTARELIKHTYIDKPVNNIEKPQEKKQEIGIVEDFSFLRSD